MKLSDAMMLGSVMCKMEPCNMMTCAMGSALNALGEATTVLRYTRSYEIWPWLTGRPSMGLDYLAIIYTTFDSEVCKGFMTFDELVAYVRRVEPSCGVCCKLVCACVKTEAEVCEVVAYV